MSSLNDIYGLIFGKLAIEDLINRTTLFSILIIATVPDT